LLCTPSQAQIDTTGLIANWKFSGNAADSSGKAHHGTITGTVTPTTGRKGISNTAMHFAGAGSYVSIPYSADLNFNKYSICAIVRPTTFYQGPCQGNSIIVRGPGSSGHWGISLNDNAFNDCSTADTTKYIFQAYSGSGHSGSQSIEQYTPTTIRNAWHCVIATYDSADIKIYINGELKVTYPSNNIGFSTDGIGIGADLFASPHTFPYTGDMDDIRVYKRVLSSEEITYYCSNAEDTTETEEPEEPTSVNPRNNTAESISIYPNPVNDKLVIAAFAGSVKDYTVTNTLGQVILTGSFADEKKELNVSELTSGIYFIKVKTENVLITRQIVIQ
jgi:hypothetical protein